MYKYNTQIKQLEVGAPLTVFCFLCAKGTQRQITVRTVIYISWGKMGDLSHLCRLVSLSSNKQLIKMKPDIWNAVLKLVDFIFRT